MSDTYIKLTDICKSYYSCQVESKIFNKVNLEIMPGQAISIRGSSGSGKSTLLKMIAGIIQPDSGCISINGVSCVDWSEGQWAKFRVESIGFIFQDFQLISSMTVLENVVFTLMLKGVQNDVELAKYWLNAVGMSHRLSHYPDVLSGGEKQRVAIARAFANKPRLILADEPTGSIDNNNRDEVMMLIHQLIKSHSPSVVLVTHDLSVASIADKQYNIYDGVLCEH